jgi:hypothetical protein
LEVQDLTLTITPIKGEATIKQVYAGNYLQTKHNTNGSVTVNFGNGEHDCSATVDLLLLATQEKIADTLEVSYSYKYSSKPSILK